MGIFRSIRKMFDSDYDPEWCAKRLKELQAESAREEVQNRQDAIEQARDLIMDHIATLSLKRSKLVYCDDYGNQIDSKWEREKGYFIDNVLLKQVIESDSLDRTQVSMQIDRLVSGYVGASGDDETAEG